MKRYLVVNHYYDTYTIEEITKKHLLGCKDHSIDKIIDLKDGLYFDPDDNAWKKVEER